MRKFYSTVRYFFFVLFIILMAMSADGQTTISTYTGSTNYTAANGVSGNSVVTFVIENTSGSDILLNEVRSYFQTASNGATVTLWYSSTSLSGQPTVATPVWTSIGTGTLSVPANGEVVAVTGMNFIIPNG